MVRSAEVNNTILKQDKIMNNMQYRAYIQRNSKSIESYNLSIAQSETAAHFPNTTYGYITGPPHLYLTLTAPNSSKYQNSDLKEWYFKTRRL
jgi:hypothetical protein